MAESNAWASWTLARLVAVEDATDPGDGAGGLQESIRRDSGCECDRVCESRMEDLIVVRARLHIKRTHTNEKPYECLECRKTFRQSAHLIRHQRLHTCEKPYKCKQCWKAFASVSDFNRHRKIHTGERLNECKKCGKVFNNYPTLTQHQIIHTSVKPYECKECGKTFTWLSNLKKHQRIHTGDKPYECKDCKKAFVIQRLFDTIGLILMRNPMNVRNAARPLGRRAHLTQHQIIHTVSKEHPSEGETDYRSSPDTISEHLQSHLSIKGAVGSHVSLSFRSQVEQRRVSSQQNLVDNGIFSMGAFKC
nr:zinc finger protein 30 homolog [Symphalangus syndactylus]